MISQLENQLIVCGTRDELDAEIALLEGCGWAREGYNIIHRSQSVTHCMQLMWRLHPLYRHALTALETSNGITGGTVARPVCKFDESPTTVRPVCKAGESPTMVKSTVGSKIKVNWRGELVVDLPIPNTGAGAR